MILNFCISCILSRKHANANWRKNECSDHSDRINQQGISLGPVVGVAARRKRGHVNYLCIAIAFSFLIFCKQDFQKVVSHIFKAQREAEGQ